MADWLILRVAVSSWLLERHASGLGDGPGDARPNLDLSCCAEALNDLAFGSARGGCSDDSVVGRQSAIWSLCPQDALWTRLQRACRGVRLDGVDGVLCDDCLSWRGLERGKFHWQNCRAGVRISLPSDDELLCRHERAETNPGCSLP